MQGIDQLRCVRLALIVSMTLCRCAIGDDSVTPSLMAPTGIVRLTDGTLLISDIESHRILQLNPTGQLTFWGGTGQAKFSGDGGHVSQATFNAPNDLKLDVANNAVLIADANNHRIRRVDLRTLAISTIAGNGTSDLSGDNGPAIQGSLNNPQGIAVDRLGNILVADTYNHVIRRIGIDGIITTVAGSTAGLSGDGGLATSAQISLPAAVAFDSDGQGFFISDLGNSRIRRVSPDGKIETVCGVGTGSDDAGAGFSGDGDLATKAKLFSPLDLAFVSPNFLYISDSGNHRIRCLVHGVIASVAGVDHPSGASQPKTSGQPTSHPDRSEVMSSLSVPAKMAIASDGGVYFCDRGNRSIRHLKKDGKMELLTLRTGFLPVPSASKASQMEKKDAK